MKHKSRLRCQDLYYSICSKILPQQELPKPYSKCFLMLFRDDLGLAPRSSPISHPLQHRELARSRRCCDAGGSRKNGILQVLLTTPPISWLKGVSPSYHETSGKNLKPPAGGGYPKTWQEELLPFRDFSTETPAGVGRKASGEPRADQRGGL